MLDKCVGAADVLQLREPDLGNDRAELARGGGDTVRCGAVTGREGLAGDDEGRGIWPYGMCKHSKNAGGWGRALRTEILEEVGEAV